MREIGMIMSAPNVLALLERRKTRTMRRIKPQPMMVFGQGIAIPNNVHDIDPTKYHIHCRLTDGRDTFLYSKYQVGDRVFVKETFFMPKKNARIWFTINKITVQSPQALRWQEIRNEGVECPEHDFDSGFCCSECSSLRRAWQELFISVYGLEAWQKNELYWVYHWKWESIEVK